MCSGYEDRINDVDARWDSPTMSAEMEQQEQLQLSDSSDRSGLCVSGVPKTV
jgi:hypothetical protein